MNRFALLYILIVIAALPGCAVSGVSSTEPIDAWIEASCTGDVMNHYASLLPGFSRDFSIAVVPTTKYMSANESDIEEAVSQAKAIGDYLHIILLASFGDTSANIYDYRRLVAFADRADIGISVAIDLRSIPAGAGFADSSIRQSYLAEIEDLLDERAPDYFNLCMEMNSFALGDDARDDYPDLVSLYEEAYDLVESRSPSTVTYFSHSWELDLLHAAEAPLQMYVDLANHIDAAGLSTFPQLAGIVEPAEIPGIYFADLPQYVSVPVIVECGFTDGAEWSSSEIIARDFPAQLVRALGDLNLSLVQLIEMHDFPADGLDEFFHGMGLRRYDGVAKPIYCGWQYIADSGA